jgi:phospholipid/cholesterol/gamma-HCH transport system permease protein
MRQHPTSQAVPRGEVCFERTPDDGALRIRLSGTWSMRGVRPPPDRARQEVERTRPRRVVLDAHGLAGWDTTLLTCVAPLLALCRERGIGVDVSDLPAGARRLLALAEAVPERVGARAPSGRPRWIARLGGGALAAFDGGAEIVRFVGEFTLAFGRMLGLRARFQLSELFLIIQQCGPQALPIVTLISFLVGLILAFMGAVQLMRFGATIYVADLVALGMAREMGAIMTAIVMAGRTGAAFAAQLGTMKVTEEIDALSTFGLSPLEFLVLPRVSALFLMMPLLCLYADFWGIVGGVVVAAGMLDLTLTQYLNETFAAVSLTDFGLGIVKSSIFGVLIGFAGCLRGLQCGGSASAVGDAATSAVVASIVLIIATDGAFAVLCNLLGI